MKKRIIIATSLIFVLAFLTIFIFSFIKLYPKCTNYDSILLSKTGGIGGMHSYYKFERRGVLYFVTERNPHNRFGYYSLGYKTKLISPVLYYWVSYKVAKLNLESIDGYYNVTTMCDGYHTQFELTRKDGRVINGYAYGMCLPEGQDFSDLLFTLDHIKKRDLIRTKISRSIENIKHRKTYNQIRNCIRWFKNNVWKFIKSIET